MKKKKKIILGSILIVFLIIVIIGIIFFKNDVFKKNNKKEEVLYTAYVKINPLVKITFKNYKYKCGKKTCNDYKEEVTKVEPLNDDAKKLVKGLNVTGERAVDVINVLCKTAKESGKTFENITIITDYNRFNNKKINEKLKLNATIKSQKNLNEKKIISEYKNNKYTVTFDANGGSKVENIQVSANETVDKPSNPVKDGYKLSGWYLDDNEFDFSTKINKDITLVAKWESEDSSKNTTSNSNKNTNTTTNTNESNKTTQTTPTCQSKKFSHKYSYVYNDNDTCMKQENLAFIDVSDNINTKVFTYGCEEIIDDCGTKYYGVYFNVYNDETDQVERWYY